MKHGVVPDFVIASEKVDLPEYFTYGEDDLKTRLILAEVANPGMFDRKVREKFVFFNPFITLSRSQAPLWGSSYFPSTGGSVTTAAFDMGLMFGCDPMVLVGQDLCFGENGTHVPGGGAGYSWSPCSWDVESIECLRKSIGELEGKLNKAQGANKAKQKRMPRVRQSRVERNRQLAKLRGQMPSRTEVL